LVGRHPDEFLVTIRIKKHELAECLRRMPQHGTIHDEPIVRVVVESADAQWVSQVVSTLQNV